MTVYHVSAGQVSSGITLGDDDTLIVLSGGIAIATKVTVPIAANLIVLSGGTASATTITANGDQVV